MLQRILTIILISTFAYGCSASKSASGLKWESLKADLHKNYRTGERLETVTITKEMVALSKVNAGADHEEYIESLMRLAIAYINCANYSQAKKTLDEAVIRYERISSTLTREAKTAFLSNQAKVMHYFEGASEEAIDIAHKIIALYGDTKNYSKLYYHERFNLTFLGFARLSRIYEALGMIDLAEETLVAGMDVFYGKDLNKNSHSYLNRANELNAFYFKNNIFNDEIKFNPAGGAGGYNPEKAVHIAYVIKNNMTEHIKEAIYCAEQGGESAYGRLAGIYIMTGNMPKAVEILKKSLKRESMTKTSTVAYLYRNTLADCYIELGMYDKAEKLLMENIKHQSMAYGTCSLIQLPTYIGLKKLYTKNNKKTKLINTNKAIVKLEKMNGRVSPLVLRNEIVAPKNLLWIWRSI